MEGDRILVVDDEQEFAETLAERLRDRDLRVDVAFDGEQALEMSAKRAYDAVILDIAMPGLDGIETLRQLRENNEKVQVVMLTGQATVDKAIEAMKLGAVDLLQKPAPMQQLIQKIEEASSRRALLVEEQMEQQLKDILSKKGW